MEETRKRRWLIFVFFGLIAALFAGFIHLATTGPRDPRYRRLENAATNYKQQLKARRPADTINIFLPLGERVRIDKNVVVYRGLENNMALIDIFISDLDPQQAYRHAVPKSDAGKQIRLGGQTFQLKSITAGKLKLKRVPN